ncbi:MAG: cytochrome c-type biogenesis protein CcmH [Gemmatimonadota bacterium]|nr:cytochrome c-type biogenesis protein CcmH [Gemmatimonadota bacterium]MDE3126581.1 cytochrome c-type biogenesis protein CcmH [Gemmatimonadota bacterium]MDE3171693.1 cytochrome c-type biogenesis protein CcmH [Gemmatimonadota bacterium]MDE3217490.1 cytochrome c-type biogenesis protein CcmH [Gemmatimonadota bacterium]
MRRFRGTLAGALLAAAAAAAPAALGAQQARVDTALPTPQLTPADSALDAQTAAVASQLRCPVCQGESIQDSPSELAMQMRDVVKEQLRAGKTPAEVKAYFVSKYGEWILLEPTTHGFNKVLYAAPYVLLLGGLGLIFVAVKRWSANGTGQERSEQE